MLNRINFPDDDGSHGRDDEEREEQRHEESLMAGFKLALSEGGLPHRIEVRRTTWKREGKEEKRVIFRYDPNSKIIDPDEDGEDDDE